MAFLFCFVKNTPIKDFFIPKSWLKVQFCRSKVKKKLTLILQLTQLTQSCQPIRSHYYHIANDTLVSGNVTPMVRDCLLAYSYHKINKLFEYFNYLDNKIRDISHSLVKRAMFWEGVMKKSKNVKSIVSVVLTASLILKTILSL